MLQGVPAVSHEEPRLLAACAQAGHPGDDDLEVEASDAQTDPRTRTREVHDEKRASAPQHAEVLGEHGPEVRDVAKRVSHGREVEVLVAERQRLRSEEHTSELQSRQYLVCRLLLEKKKKNNKQ